MKVQDTDLIRSPKDYIDYVAQTSTPWAKIAEESITLDRSGKYSLAINLFNGDKLPENKALSFAIMAFASLEGNVLAKQWIEKRQGIEINQLNDGNLGVEVPKDIKNANGGNPILKENEEYWRSGLTAFKNTAGVTADYFAEEATRELTSLTGFSFTPAQIDEFLGGVSLNDIIAETRKIEFETRRLKREKERKIELYENTKAELLKIINLIKPALIHHLPTLSLRRSQLLRVDHYGRQIREEWDAEIDYFILHFLVGGDNNELNSLKSNQSIKSTYNRVFRIIDYAAFCWSDAESTEFDWAELDPISFERECASELSRLGWSTRTTAGSGDQGIDVIATTPRVKLVVQCKRYANSVGNSAVQEIIAGREFERANYAAVISTGVFTKSARALASSANVILLHPEEIAGKLSAKIFDNEAVASALAPKIHDMDNLLAAILDFNVRSEIERQTNLQNKASPAESDDEEDDEVDDLDDDLLYEKALSILKATRRAATTTFQRRLNIGYNRAARLMDLLEERGIVGPEKGAEPRQILINLD